MHFPALVVVVFFAATALAQVPTDLPSCTPTVNTYNPLLPDEEEDQRAYLDFLEQVTTYPLSREITTPVIVQDQNGFYITIDLLNNCDTCTGAEDTHRKLQKAVEVALPNIAWQYRLDVNTTNALMQSSSDIVDQVLDTFAHEGGPVYESLDKYDTLGSYEAGSETETETETESNTKTRHNTKKRSAMHKRNFFEDIACGIFAVVGLPAYLTLYAVMHVANTLGHSTSLLSTEQKFFASSAHGNLAQTAGVKFYFGAGVISILGSSVLAITFNTEVFVAAGQVPSSSSGEPFFQQARTVTHELQHVVQYQNDGWSLLNFGWSYLNSYCENGFHYSQIWEEVEAFAVGDHVYEQLHILHPEFFNVWKSRNLRPKLGFPLSADPIGFSDGSEVLQFELGYLQFEAGSTICARILSSDFFDVQAAAQCVIDTHPYHPAGLCAKYPDKPICDPDYYTDMNNKCLAAKHAWATIQSTTPPYTCS